MDRHQPINKPGHSRFGCPSRGRGNKRLPDGNFKDNIRNKARGTNQHDSASDRNRYRSGKGLQTKQRPGVKNDGLEYQYRVITYVAASLSENSDVKDYIVYSNLDNVPGFDDIVVKVWFKEKEIPYTYLGQIKHKKDKINFEKEKHPFSHYREAVQHIITEKDNIKCLQGVPEENIDFFFYLSNDLIQHQDILINKENPSSQCHIEVDKSYSPAFSIRTSNDCYKFVSDSQEDVQDLFLNKTHLFLKQSCNEEILQDIMDLFKNEFSTDMALNFTRFVQNYFETEPVNSIPKDVFETELFRVRLSSYIVKPDMSVEMNADQVEMWNKITTNYDIIMVDGVGNIERNLCGCLLQKINKFFVCDLKWEELVINRNGKLSKTFNMKHCIKSKVIRSWDMKPDTIDSLLTEMWRYDEMPLMLKMNDDMSILEKYKYLKKKFILICDAERKYNDLKGRKFNIFASVADIENVQNRTDFLKIIRVSLQGRVPVSLGDIIDEDSNCMEKLKSYEILNLIKKRKPYLETRSFEKVELMIIHKTTTKANERDYEDFTVENSSCKNFLINCPDIHIQDMDNCRKYKDLINQHPECKEYSLCHLQEDEDKLEFIKGDADKLKAFLVDEDDNFVYRSKSGIYVPVIGNNLGNQERGYIPRSLHKPIINPKIFEEGHRVYFFCGDLEHLDTEIKNKIIEDPACLKINNGNIFFGTGKFSVEEQEKLVADMDTEDTRPVLYVEVIKRNLGLLRFRNCNDLSSYLSYDENIIPEIKFHEPTNLSHCSNNQITVISGEAGMGKTTLLHSLSETYDERYLVLFCDLADCCRSMKQFERFEYALDVEFSKCMGTRAYYKNFLHTVYKYHINKGKAILFIDSFDEILPVYQEKGLNFIKEIAKTEIKVVIASRSIANNLIVDQINVRPLKISNLRGSEAEAFFRSKRRNVHISNIPKEFLINPLYLKFLVFFSEKESLTFIDADKVNLYDKVLSEKIKRYYHKKDEPYDYKINSMNEEVMEVHELMAMVVIFGEEWLVKQNIIKDYKKLQSQLTPQKLKLGLVKEFREDHPVFIHQTVVEFLAAKWLSENIFKEENAEDIFKGLLYRRDTSIKYFFDRMVCKNLELHQAVLKGDLALVRDICNNHSANVEKVDKCGRNCLHLASEYCYGIANVDECRRHCLHLKAAIGGFEKHEKIRFDEESEYCPRRRRCYIMEILVLHLLRSKYDFNTPDKYMEWNWFNYLKFNNKEYLEDICDFGLSTVLIICHKFEKQVVEHNDINYVNYALSNYNCNTLSLLFRIDISILEKNFYEVVDFALCNYGSLYTACEMIHLWCKSDPRLIVFLKVCQDLCEITQIKNVEYITEIKVTFCEFTALHVACFHGHVSLVRQLLQSEADVAVRDKFHRTALHYAVIQGSIEIIDLLLQPKNGAIVNLKDSSGHTSFHFAVRFSKLNVIQLLLEHGAEINEIDSTGENVLHTAARRGSFEICQILLHNGVNIIHMYYKSALLIAVQSGFLEILHLLVSRGANVFKRGHSGDTVLHLACRAGHDNIVKYLLSKWYHMSTFRNVYDETPVDIAVNYGKPSIIEIFKQSKKALNIAKEIEWLAEPFKNEEGDNLLHLSRSAEEAKLQLSNNEIKDKINSQAHNRETALHVACRNGYVDIVELLLLNKADISMQDISGRTPFHVTIKNGNVDIAKMLLRYGVSVNSKNNFMETPLHFAVKNRNIELVRLLVKSGAAINHQNDDGRSALHMAAKLVETDIAEILLRNHADVNQTDYCDTTALHISVEYQNTKTFKLLLDHGANVNYADNCGNTVLHIAVEHQNSDIVEILLRNAVVTSYVNIQGKSAVDIAVTKQNTIIQTKLFQNCLDTDNFDNCDSCVKIAVLKGDALLVKTILGKGANINEPNNTGVLHIAVQQEDAGMTKLLLDNGAYINQIEYSVTALQIAVIQQNLELVQILLENEADVNCVGYLSYSPLHLAVTRENLDISKLLLLKCNANIKQYIKALNIAAGKRNIEILNMLLKHDLDIESLTEDNVDIYLRSTDRETGFNFAKVLLQRGIRVNVIKNKSLLYVDIKEGILDIASFMLKAGIDINLLRFDQQSALCIAVELEDMNLLDTLIKAGIDINYLSEWKGSALHVAIDMGNIQYVKLLLKNGINVNLMNRDRGSALHIAVEKENMDIINLLLKKGIDVNLSSLIKGPVLSTAIELENINIVRLLLKEIENINIKDHNYIVCLAIACERKNFDIIELLLKAGININDAFFWKRTLLHVVVEAGSSSLVKLFFEKCANLKKWKYNCESVLHIAVEKEYIDIVKLLVETGIDTNFVSEHGQSPLHIAIEKENVDIVRLLIAHNADLNLKSIQNQSPLHIAINKNNAEIVKLLLETQTINVSNVG